MIGIVIVEIEVYDLPAMRPAMMPSEVESALGDKAVFGLRRIRSERISSSNRSILLAPSKLDFRSE